MVHGLWAEELDGDLGVMGAHDGRRQPSAEREPTSQPRIPIPDKNFGAAVEFTRVGGYVELIPGAVGLDIGGNQLTIALWVFLTDVQANQAHFISKAQGSNPQDYFWMVGTTGTGRVLHFQLNTDEADTATQLESDPALGGLLEEGVWTHVAVTYDGEHMLIYKDGEEVGTRLKSGSNITDELVDTWIGDNPPGGGRSFNGFIDEVRLYSRVLDVDQIQRIMNSPLPPPPGA